MANRYWVGGSGSWSASSTANWSATSGGASGASVPTATDVAIFDQAATYTVTISGTGSRTALTLLNTAGTVTFAGTALLQLGGLTLAATAVWSRTANINFTIAGAHTLNTNGVTIQAFGVTFNAAGAVWTMTSNFTTGGSTTLAFVDGTLDLSGYTLSAYFVSLYAYDSGLEPTTVELIMNSGTLQAVEGVLLDLLEWPSTVIPTITGPGTIELLGDTPDNLTIGSSTGGPPDPADTRVAGFPTFQHIGSVALIVLGSNTFETFESPSSAGGVTFIAGTTNTFGSFDVLGASGALKTLTANTDGYTAATQATLLKSTPWFVGANSVDEGNNTGLIFSGTGAINYLAISNIAVTTEPVYGWVLIDDSQTSNWQNASTTQTPAWQNINDGQDPAWSPVNT